PMALRPGSTAMVSGCTVAAWRPKRWAVPSRRRAMGWVKVQPLRLSSRSNPLGISHDDTSEPAYLSGAWQKYSYRQRMVSYEPKMAKFLRKDARMTTAVAPSLSISPRGQLTARQRTGLEQIARRQPSPQRRRAAGL